MRCKQVRFLLLFVLLGAGLAIGVQLTVRFLMPQVRMRKVERVIARFETQPSQAGADELVRLLERQAPTFPQGNRILEGLFQPRVLVRPTYALGSGPVVCLERPFGLDFRRGQISMEESVWFAGKYRYGNPKQRLNPVGRSPQFYPLRPKPGGGGSYHMEIRRRYIMYLPVEGGWFWRPSLRGPLPWSLLPRKRSTGSRACVGYTCRVDTPVEITVVQQAQAETMGVISDPGTAAQMRAVFSSALESMEGTYAAPAGRRSCQGGVRITYDRLPAAVAFEPVLRLPDGREITPHITPTGDTRADTGRSGLFHINIFGRPGIVPGVPHATRVRARAGSSGAFLICPAIFQVTEPGEYSGTIILKPDPNYAYEDPVITAIWGGTLEFPIHFIISAEDNVE